MYKMRYKIKKIFSHDSFNEKIIEIRDCIIANKSRTFYEPKLLTVGNDENLDKKEFYARYLKFRNECPWLIGGTYVHEKGKENGMWHSHGVMIAPFIQRCDNPAEHPDVPFIKYENYERIETEELVPCSCRLQRWSSTAAEKWGLGNVHYQCANIDKSGFKDAHVANYIAKYMCKDGGRKQSFGALYNCEIEEIKMPDGSIKKIWNQPNVKKYRSKIYNWMKTEGKKWTK